MNKFKVEKLVVAQLIEAQDNKTFAGIKNMIGLIVVFDKKEYFYSIFDDCFFRCGKVTFNNWKQQDLFAEPYSRDYGLTLKAWWNRKGLDVDLITKEELIKRKNELYGYFSDLEYDGIKKNVEVDFRSKDSFKKFLISSEYEYEKVLDRPIQYIDGYYKVTTRKRLIN